jgi:hypothetical protein
MRTLSSYAFSYISISLPRCGESHLPPIDRNTYRQLNPYPLPKNLLGEVMSPAWLRRNTR